MNANCYRLVLDRRTGALVPVAEIATKSGKGRGRNRSGNDGATSTPQWGGLYTAMAFAGLLAPGLGGAQTVTPDGAGNPVSVNVTANNVPLINIADPNANGLSHNKFTEFNVGEQGLIFNNSLSDGVTQIGGAAMKNPHLTRQASGILTEVTGTSITQLKGAMEVFGGKADVLIAKQNGVFGDRGAYMSNTLTVQLGAGISAFVGADAGAVKDNHHDAEHQFISGAAAGLRARWKNASLALTSATPLGANRAQPSVLYANVNVRF